MSGWRDLPARDVVLALALLLTGVGIGRATAPSKADLWESTWAHDHYVTRLTCGCPQDDCVVLVYGPGVTLISSVNATTGVTTVTMRRAPGPGQILVNHDTWAAAAGSGR